MKILWGLLWNSYNQADGFSQYLLYDNCRPLFFDTREEARHYARLKYGYIKERKDLRDEPHGWRMPIPVKIRSIQWEK